MSLRSFAADLAHTWRRGRISTSITLLVVSLIFFADTVGNGNPHGEQAFGVRQQPQGGELLGAPPCISGPSKLAPATPVSSTPTCRSTPDHIGEGKAPAEPSRVRRLLSSSSAEALLVRQN